MEGVRFAQDYLQYNRPAIKHNFKLACNFLPVAYAKECRNRVGSEVMLTIDEIVSDWKPQVVCGPYMLGFCDKTAGIPNTKHPDWLFARGHHGDIDVN